VRRAAVFLATALLVPLSLAVAEWSEDEQAFLDWQKSCWTDDSPGMVDRCFHEDYAGWGNGYAVPYNKADRNTLYANRRTRTDSELLSLKPMEVRVMDDTAVSLYVVTYEISSRRDEEARVVTERWTDVSVRENGEWQWIADHGEPID